MDGKLCKDNRRIFCRFQTQLGKFNYDPNYPGCGAAGGLGFAFRTFLHGKLEPGISIVLEEIGIENQIKNADIVITGEGRLDGQTVMGKAPIGIARLAKKYGKPVLAFSGSVTEDAASCNEAGIDAFFPILRQVTTLEEAMDPQTAQKNMESAVEQVFRVIRLKEMELAEIMGGKVLELESDKLIEQGLELGRLENQMATAVKMLQVGKYTIEEIADISGLTVKKYVR